MKRLLVILSMLLGIFVFPDVAHAQKFLMDGFGKCLHIPQESRSNGVQLRTWDCLNKTHIKWEVLDSAFKISIWDGLQSPPPGSSPQSNFFWLRNVMTGKCAAVHKGQKDDGAWVVQWDCSHEKHFQWAWKGGQLMHRASGKCLYVESGGRYSKVTIRQCDKAQTPPDKQWSFVSAAGFIRNGFGKCLSADTVPTLSTKDCTNSNERLWTQLANRDGYVSFQNRKTGKCVGTFVETQIAGMLVGQYDCGSGRNFQWKGLGGKLVHRSSQKCLQVKDGVSLVIADCYQPPNTMKWTLR